MKQEEWQKGNDSELTSLQRLELHNLWLKKVHEGIKQIIKEEKMTDTKLQGFPKD